MIQLNENNKSALDYVTGQDPNKASSSSANNDTSSIESVARLAKQQVTTAQTLGLHQDLQNCTDQGGHDRTC